MLTGPGRPSTALGALVPHPSTASRTSDPACSSRGTLPPRRPTGTRPGVARARPSPCPGRPSSSPSSCPRPLGGPSFFLPAFHPSASLTAVSPPKMPPKTPSRLHPHGLPLTGTLVQPPSKLPATGTLAPALSATFGAPRMGFGNGRHLGQLPLGPASPAGRTLRQLHRGPRSRHAPLSPAPLPALPGLESPPTPPSTLYTPQVIRASAAPSQKPSWTCFPCLLCSHNALRTPLSLLFSALY